MYIYFRLMRKQVIKNGYTVNKGKVKGTINTIFGKYLFLTNTVSCGLLMAAGDLIQQEIEIYGSHEKKAIDWKRTGRMFVVGLAQGPPQHIFYKVLDWSLPKRDFRTITKKIILDQLIASPVCICIFFFGMGWLEGHTWDETISESKRKFLPVYMVYLIISMSCISVIRFAILLCKEDEEP